MKESIVILIPAYNPNGVLIELIKLLYQNDVILLVVNDGSNDTKIFSQIEKYCKVIHNEKNLGKGKALKVGLSYILKNYSNIIGVITADADGQHLVKDINKLKMELQKLNNEVILGVRNFKTKNIPFRSKVGNRIINYLFKIRTGVKLKDTQTGLRGIPLEYVKRIIEISGDRYEYEINVLKLLAKEAKIKEVDIETVYEKNIKSEFRTIKDSIKVMIQFLLSRY